MPNNATKVASELQGTILKVFINRFGEAVLCECGSAEFERQWQGHRAVFARVLCEGYLHRACVKLYDSDEFAQAAVAEINYPVSLIAAL